jgi:hypothetical protein
MAFSWRFSRPAEATASPSFLFVFLLSPASLVMERLRKHHVSTMLLNWLLRCFTEAAVSVLFTRFTCSASPPEGEVCYRRLVPYRPWQATY